MLRRALTSQASKLHARKAYVTGSLALRVDFPSKVHNQYRIVFRQMGTADLCDEYGDSLQYAETQFRDFGAQKNFSGQIVTVKCYEDNSVVKKVLSEPGNGKVLVVDGAGSFKRALLGDNVAASAIQNGWSGIIINGCVRDSEMLATMKLGIKALGTSPRKTEKRAQGERDTVIHFGGVHYQPGHYVYADMDGIVVSEVELGKPKL